MARDIQIRPASDEEISNARWVRRHREGNKKKTNASQFDRVDAILSSGMGTVCIEGNSWDDVNSTLQTMRNEAVSRGFSLQAVEIRGSRGTKYLVRKIQSPENFIGKEDQDNF